MTWHLTDYNQIRRRRLKDNIKMVLEYIGWLEGWLDWCGPGHGQVVGTCERKLTSQFLKILEISWLADKTIRFLSSSLLHEGGWCIRVEVGTEFLAYSSGAITITHRVCARKEGNDVTLLICSDASYSSREQICVYCPNISSAFRTAIQYN